VVARLPLRRPAAPQRSAPVQTERTIFEPQETQNFVVFHQRVDSISPRHEQNIELRSFGEG